MASVRCAPCAPCRLQVDGREIAAGGDAEAGEGGVHAFAADFCMQADYIDKPANVALRKRERRALEARYSCEESVVSLGSLTTEREDLVDPPQLNATERAGQL